MNGESKEGVAVAAGSQVTSRPLSLRAKGYVAFAVLIAYAFALIWFVVSERGELLAQTHELQNVSEREEGLSRIRSALNDVNIAASDAVNATPAEMGRLLGVIERKMTGIEQLQSHGAKFDGKVDELRRHLGMLRDTQSRAHIIELRAVLLRLTEDIDVLTEQSRQHRSDLANGYQRRYDSIILMVMGFGILGLVVFGALITLFFSRLAADISGLGTRARSIVMGHRGEPVVVTRADEVGQLMQDINKMAAELKRREEQIEISRQQYFHREKMAVVGSLASGIAHEIGNPIAAIAGVAQAIEQEQQSRMCPSTGATCRPDLILQQTSRIASITREISEFTAQRPPDMDWLDLNGLVRSTCNFMRYDRRFRDIKLTLELDDQLPAVMAVGDHVVQVVMNLLANAADAVSEVPGRTPVIVLRTRPSGNFAYLEVVDNGCGMDEKTLKRSCDPFFTTKKPGKGTGLGLAMSKAILKNVGGDLVIESEQGTGTTVRILLSTEQVTSTMEN